MPGLNRDWKLFREMQLEISQTVSDVGMAVVIDVGHPNNVHPVDKKPVGDRLARLALARTYRLEIVASGPSPTGIEFGNGQAKVVFDQQLEIGDGDLVKGFVMAGSDREFMPATGLIQGKSVILRSDTNGPIKAVRYAWDNDPEGSLRNKEGLPVGPFRSDQWPVPSAGK